MILAPLALAASLLVSLLAQVPYRHEKPEFELTLPSPQWRIADQSAGALVNCAFSPTPDAVTRAVVMTFPKTLIPNGLASREEQQKTVAGERYVRIGMEEGTLSGRDATRWEYAVGNSTIIEWAFLDGENYVVLQIAAPLTVWGNAGMKSRLDSIHASFRWIGGAMIESNLSRATAEEARAMRAALRAEITPPDYVVSRHRIHARIEPTASSIELSDVLDIESRKDGLAEIRLYTSVVKIAAVECAREVRFRVEPDQPSDTIVVTFAQPLAAGDRVELTVRAESQGFTRPSESEAPAPYRAYGQIEPYSSFSSHVLWYPIDRTNDAAVEITFDVPAPYVALTGGERTSSEEKDGRIVSRFVEDHRIHRDLPFPFVLTDGTNFARKLESGLELSVHNFADKGDAAKRVLELTAETAVLLEEKLGPLPWGELRVVRVVGERPTSISILPGTIFVPSGLFDSIADANLADGNLSDMNDNAMLVLTDAVTRQWTGVGADLSLEFVEGLATFAKALLVERRYGEDAYGKTLAFCRSTWLTSVGELPEFAIGDPRVDSNRLFLPTVGCKMPVVLALLRKQLGDEVFFAALRDALFATDPTADSLERFETAFTRRSGRDLRSFFDTWILRSGAPRLRLESSIAGDTVKATVFQMQGDDAYPIDLELEVEDASGAKTRHPISLAGKDLVVELAVANAKAVVIADADRLPVRFE